MATIIFTILMQSLWLGLILAAITGLILLCTRHTQSAIRYRLLTGALILFTGAMAGVTLVAMRSALNSYATCTNDNNTIIPAANPFAAINLFGGGWAALNTFVTQYAPYLAWAWFVVIVVKLLLMAAGLYKMNELKRRDVIAAGTWWQGRVHELATQIGIDKSIQLLQSALITVPVAIGHLKPVILMPVGLINNLSVAEVDAIICHELAHIKRNDYLINLLQTIMGILFFFNPAVIWINNVIRNERENCCDDIALAINKDVHAYVKALLSCSEFQLGVNGCAMAFAGKKGQLMERVKRLIGHRNTRSTSKVFLGLLVVGSLLLAVALSMPDGGGKQITRIWIETPEMKKEIKTIDLSAPISTKGASPSSEGAVKYQNVEDDVAADQAQVVADNEEPAPPDVVADATQPEKEAFTEEDGDNMKAELRTDGIISNTVNTRYELNAQRLVVNDIKQPEEIHRKYFDKYLKYSGRTVTYNYAYKGN